MRWALRPPDTAIPYSDSDFEPLRHAHFAQHALWVTRYRDAELYASGEYPNQGTPDQGPPKYIATHESVDSKDLVVWYTVGFTHVPNIEEFPVMTTESVGFSLRPNGFFDRNPALDAP